MYEKCYNSSIIDKWCKQSMSDYKFKPDWFAV